MPHEPPKLALSRAEAARALGVSERLVWELTKQGELPHVRLNGRHGRIIYPVDALKDWLREHAQGGSLPAGVAESDHEADERGC